MPLAPFWGCRGVYREPVRLMRVLNGALFADGAAIQERMTAVLRSIHIFIYLRQRYRTRGPPRCIMRPAATFVDCICIYTNIYKVYVFRNIYTNIYVIIL
jgi:hypothetical protein